MNPGNKQIYKNLYRHLRLHGFGCDACQWPDVRTASEAAKYSYKQLFKRDPLTLSLRLRLAKRNNRNIRKQYPSMPFSA